MTKKAWIYSGIGAVVLIAGYFNYFGEDKKLDTLKKVIETSNAIYKSADYFVEAKKQIDYVDDKETKFEVAKAIVKGMALSGDNVVIDKLRNLVLKNNILGVSENGWKFNTSELRYNKATDEIISEAGVAAINEKKGIHLEGKKFLTTTSMSHILLENGVKFEVGRAGLRGEKAEYDDSSKKILLSGNVELYNSKKDGKEFRGKFGDMSYDVEAGRGETNLPFEITYNETQLEAEKLVFYPEENAFHLEQNVNLTSKDYKATLSAMDKKAGEELIHFVGPIRAQNEEYSCSMNRAVYDIVKKEITMIGNIDIVSKKGDRLKADRAVYHEAEKILNVYGDGNKVNYDGNGHHIEAEEFQYDVRTGDIRVLSPYRYRNQKGDIFEGNNLEYKKETGKAIIKGEVRYQSKDYTVKTVDLDYARETGILTIANPYFIQMKDGSTFEGKSAVYNEKTGDLVSPGSIYMIGKDYVAHGHDLKYNNHTGKGSLEGPVNLLSETQNFNITGDRAVFDQKSGAVMGNVKGNLQGTMITSSKAIYKTAEKMVELPEPIQYRNSQENLHGSMKSGKYFVEAHQFQGKDFVALRAGEKVTSDYAEYFTEEKRAELTGKVRMENADQVVTTEKASYEFIEKYAEIPTTFQLQKGQFLVNGDSGNVNFTTQKLYVTKPSMNSEVGEHFEAERLEGNLKTLVMDFRDKVYGKTVQKNVLSEYRGEKARVYLAKEQNQYRAKKLEVFEDAVFTQEDKTLKGKRGQYDFDTNLVNFYGDVFFSSKDGSIRSDEMFYNTQTKKAKAKGNVKMNYSK